MCYIVSCVYWNLVRGMKKSKKRKGFNNEKVSVHSARREAGED